MDKFNTLLKTNQHPEKKIIKEAYCDGFKTKSMLENDTITPAEKRWHLYGIAAEGDIKNGNNRIYESKILDSAFNKWLVNIQEKTPFCLGELGHPTGQDPNRNDSDINFDFVSHMILEAKKEGKNQWKTKSKILKNPIGLNYVVPILEEGIVLAFSTRGLGESNFSESEGAEIVSEYELLTIDLVARPSAPRAQQKGMLETTKRFAKMFMESKRMASPKSPEAKNIKQYYETLNYFKSINKENKFVEAMEAYNWQYSEFWKDAHILTMALLKGEELKF